ncbi:hypothetical protein FACS189443_2860 [Planctomycetales bacterium]|nr:hypothetical protein FACS189443_2860 [Planctomycetales bacterium]
MSQTKSTRRQFLKAATAVAVASPLVIPRSVLAQNGQPGANDTVKIALVGLGGRCTEIYPNDVKAANGGKVVAVCDILQTRVDRFMNRYKDFTPEQGYTDLRKMIEKAKPDGVMCETTTHQRAWTVAQSIVAGCHVYIEKPIVLTIAEGRYLVNLARKHKPPTQDGRKLRRYRRRYKTERTNAWLQNYRRSVVRYDHKIQMFDAFLQLACCMICARKL